MGVKESIMDSLFERNITKRMQELSGQSEPEYLYHATYKPLLRSIQKNGLGGEGRTKFWDDSDPQLVYLAADVDTAVSYAEIAELADEDLIDQIVVLRVKTDALDEELLTIDSNNLSGDTYQYAGIISPEYLSVV